jgi:hypothetical protein
MKRMTSKLDESSFKNSVFLNAEINVLIYVPSKIDCLQGFPSDAIDGTTSGRLEQAKIFDLWWLVFLLVAMSRSGLCG